MLPSPEDAATPGRDSGGERNSSSQQAGGLVATLPLEPAALAAFRGAYAVLVRTDDRSTRSLFLSLSAAEQKADRVRARGGRADLVLLQLVPVEGGAA